MWNPNFCCFNIQDHQHSKLSLTVHESLCSSVIDQVSVDLAKRTAEEFLKVVERQAERYLPGGALASLEPEMIVLGTNAPADNIVAESVLGLTDNIMRKCRTATGSYISSKASFAVNKTYDWLLTMRKEGRIPKAIAQARECRRRESNSHRDIKAEIVERMKIRSQKHIDRQRKQWVKQISQFMTNPSTFKDNVLSVDKSVSAECIDAALEVIHCVELLEGRDIIWVWSENGEDVSYQYRVLKQKNEGDFIKYKALVWTLDCTVDDASQVYFFLHDFLADMLAEDAWFV